MGKATNKVTEAVTDVVTEVEDEFLDLSPRFIKFFNFLSLSFPPIRREVKVMAIVLSVPSLWKLQPLASY